ncbi:hypothetical protein ABE10_01015, partial [Bacillus toyonensis]|nr:hypothetical protein [Bacillus toyonensis]
MDPMTASPTTPMLAAASGTSASDTMCAPDLLGDGISVAPRHDGARRRTGSARGRASVLPVAGAAHGEHGAETEDHAGDRHGADQPEEDMGEEGAIEHAFSLSGLRVAWRGSSARDGVRLRPSVIDAAKRAPMLSS